MVFISEILDSGETTTTTTTASNNNNNNNHTNNANNATTPSPGDLYEAQLNEKLDGLLLPAWEVSELRQIIKATIEARVSEKVSAIVQQIRQQGNAPNEKTTTTASAETSTTTRQQLVSNRPTSTHRRAYGFYNNHHNSLETSAACTLEQRGHNGGLHTTNNNDNGNIVQWDMLGDGGVWSPPYFSTNAWAPKRQEPPPPPATIVTTPVVVTPTTKHHATIHNAHRVPHKRPAPESAPHNNINKKVMMMMHQPAATLPVVVQDDRMHRFAQKQRTVEELFQAGRDRSLLMQEMRIALAMSSYDETTCGIQQTKQNQNWRHKMQVQLRGMEECCEGHPSAFRARLADPQALELGVPYRCDCFGEQSFSV